MVRVRLVIVAQGFADRRMADTFGVLAGKWMHCRELARVFDRGFTHIVLAPVSFGLPRLGLLLQQNDYLFYRPPETFTWLKNTALIVTALKRTANGCLLHGQFPLRPTECAEHASGC